MPRCVSGHATGANEARQLAWLTVDEAARDMMQSRAVRITDALSGNGPFVRVHNGTSPP
jgi:8-oxo-dGTP diphosphatase